MWGDLGYIHGERLRISSHSLPLTLTEQVWISTGLASAMPQPPSGPLRWSLTPTDPEMSTSELKRTSVSHGHDGKQDWDSQH